MYKCNVINLNSLKQLLGPEKMLAGQIKFKKKCENLIKSNIKLNIVH